VLAQHIECRYAEMAGADEGDPHGGLSVLSYCIWAVDNTSQEAVTPTAAERQRVINKTGENRKAPGTASPARAQPKIKKPPSEISSPDGFAVVVPDSGEISGTCVIARFVASGSEPVHIWASRIDL
jgi:hypothetical protein